MKYINKEGGEKTLLLVPSFISIKFRTNKICISTNGKREQNSNINYSSISINILD